jgi:CRP/FNR family transcriptional regulator, cyclic AMP receptor protein
VKADQDLQAVGLIHRFRGSWPLTSFMARLDQEALHALAAGQRGRRFEAGQTLLVEGDPATHVLLLMSAQVKITARLDRGMALLAVRIGGDILGEMGVADGGLRSATVTAIRDDTIAVAVPAEEFLSVGDRFPQVGRLLASELTRKLRAANRRRADFTAYPVPVRVARVLAEMTDEYGEHVERKPTVRILRVGLSQSEFATLIGAREASVAEALRDLRSRGILEWGYRTVTIRDLEALRSAGQPIPGDTPPGEIP